MSPLGIQLSRAFVPDELDSEEYPLFEELEKMGAFEKDEEGLYRLKSIYRIGKIHISADGKGYLEAPQKELRDLLIAPENLKGAKNGDEVVVRRIIAARGRASAKVIMVLQRAIVKIIAYSHIDEEGRFSLRNIKNAQSVEATMEGMEIKAFKRGTVFLIDALSMEVKEIVGNLEDPRVDERISLLLYDREGEKFPQECVEQALEIPSEVLAQELEGRVDLRALDFCTIDPVSAKDFDDAIYFDTDRSTLYVAIADVGHYVPFFSPIDLEAKRRGFTTYLPHKAFPMLPRELSENICSLKPGRDRLAFVCKIVLDPKTLEAKEESFFKAIIHSRRRFNYDEIDEVLSGEKVFEEGIEKSIMQWLLPLSGVTSRLRKKRLKKGFDFRSDEVKITIDARHLLKETSIESGTASHSLIEECMLLANKAAAKRFEGEEDAIFRIHEAPEREKMRTLLEELAGVGIFVEADDEANPAQTIREIQAEAAKAGLEAEIDALIIKSLKRARYSAFNVGHFGLGFDKYSHFTSPIRRYSDLILHRLIEAELESDSRSRAYLLRNIESLCARVSDLERKATKAEWDFRDRKFARWAAKHIGECFDARISEMDENEAGRPAKALLLCEMEGITVEIVAGNAPLFEHVKVKLTHSDIAEAKIQAEIITLSSS